MLIQLGRKFKPLPMWESREVSTMLTCPTIAVVDDDESVRESLPDLLRELGFDALAFSSAEEFLESDRLAEIRCLILDIAMPGMSGLQLQKQMKRGGYQISTIFITAHRGESVLRQAFEPGAVECLYKPFSDTALLKALNLAFKKN